MIRFRTENGSVYEIDNFAGIWRRRSHADRPDPENPLRTEYGPFISHTIPTVGESVTLICPPIVQGSDARMITTSAVVAIEKMTGPLPS